MASLARLASDPNPSKFKLDIIQNIPEGEKISLYRNGEFTDLCAGPHVMRTGNIGAFKLTNVASAYYKGDEKNPQLQRIYGTAFKNKTQLDDYFAMLEEAKKRDHRKLGKELELFTFDDDVGPGLPLWLPRGAAIIEELEKLAKETEFAAGYQRVRTPHIARESLYITSGHLPYYAESMFPPMTLVEDTDKERLEKANAMIAHSKTIAEGLDGVLERRSQKSVDPATRDDLLPNLSWFEAQSERTKSKLSRVEAIRGLDWRSLLPQGDELPASPQAVCSGAAQLSRPAVAARGIRDLLSLRAERRTVRTHAGALAADERRPPLLTPRAVRSGVQRRERDVSELFQALRDREISSCASPPTIPQSSARNSSMNRSSGKRPRRWCAASCNASGINYVEVPNEAAFYGPKIDVQVWSAIGREFSIATNQVDFAQPRSFDLRLQRPRQHRQDPALHSSRAARHARAFHRLPDRALRRQFPALARAGTGPHPPDRRRSPLLDYARSIRTNCAPIKSAPNSTPAATTSTAKFSVPSK